MLDRDVVAHESAHAAAAVLLGLEVSAVDCIGDGRTYSGQLRYYRNPDDDQRREEIKTLFVGNDINDGFPPTGNVRDGHDIAHLRRLVDELRLDVGAYYRLKAEAEDLAKSPAFKSLATRFESALETNGRLGEADVRAIVDRWRWDSSQRD